MALPRTKYSNARHTPGGEFTLRGKEYVGWYVETYQNKFFTGKVIDVTSKELTPVVRVNESNSPVYVEQIATPTQDDRLSGFWMRYFIQNKSNNSIIEVNRERYGTFKNSSRYKRAKLTWKIKGPADNQLINGYTYFGAEHVNRLNTEALNTTIIGIKDFITDYSKFVE